MPLGRILTVYKKISEFKTWGQGLDKGQGCQEGRAGVMKSRANKNRSTRNINLNYEEK